MICPTYIVAAVVITKNEKDEILLVKIHGGGWVFPGRQVENLENMINVGGVLWNNIL